MGPKKSRDDWTTMAIRRDLKARVKRLVESEGGHGYTSPTAFVNDAVRRRLEDVEAKLDALAPEVERAANRIKSLPLPSNQKHVKFCAQCGFGLNGPFCQKCGHKNW